MDWISQIYDDLKLLAAAKMSHEPVEHTLGATALVHEVFLRLEKGDQKWDSPGHYFASAAIAMRRILIDRARGKKRIKHGGEHQRVELNDPAEQHDNDRLVSLVSAMEELAKEDPLAAKVVDLHHFAGMSHDLVARQLEITVYNARQKWTYARAWLKSELN